MTDDHDNTARQISEFAARWFTDNYCVNIRGKAEDDCATRLRQAIEAAFPQASKVDVQAAFQIVKAVLDHHRGTVH
jgi:hypothetical protein